MGDVDGKGWSAMVMARFARLFALLTLLALLATPLSSAMAQQTNDPPPSVPPSEDEVVRGDPSRPWMSLIFNAGAGYEPAPQILDTLKEKGVHTTFFLMGWWAEKNPELVRRIAEDGHEVASHGHRIFDLTKASDAEVAGDLERADAVISAITGKSTRPLWSASAGYRDARVHRIAAGLGYRPIFWSADGGDWRFDSSAAGVRGRVLRGAGNGAIVVLHFESPRTADTIAAALPEIIDGIRAQGLRLVTVTELVTGHLRD
jgi:peptidoglycan/xylan/chitin deacetylase (PgdA/CDA1 family)